MPKSIVPSPTAGVGAPDRPDRCATDRGGASLVVGLIRDGARGWWACRERPGRRC